MRALLDVNVWIALFDDAHQFSDRANAYIETRGARIATCPLVENGVLRVMSLPSYGRRGGLGLQLVRERLREACATLDHEFWPDDVSLHDDELSISRACKATTRSPIFICWPWQSGTGAVSSPLTRPSRCRAYAAQRPGTC